ncbi:class I tRNA ligase family protein, partial [Staphylococcus epidermidis]|uniref:class I tRNA ligase family protein n=1 Tax=Staphylococcus epidermidis TaxID=1282 RepID=UPI0011A5E7AD
FKPYYPTNPLVTPYHIIFFSLPPIIFQPLQFTDTTPFNHLLLHPLLTPQHPPKITKSLPNPIHPIDLIHQYPPHTLPYFLP